MRSVDTPPEVFLIHSHHKHILSSLELRTLVSLEVFRLRMNKIKIMDKGSVALYERAQSSPNSVMKICRTLLISIWTTNHKNYLETESANYQSTYMYMLSGTTGAFTSNWTRTANLPRTSNPNSSSQSDSKPGTEKHWPTNQQWLIWKAIYLWKISYFSSNNCAM